MISPGGYSYSGPGIYAAPGGAAQQLGGLAAANKMIQRLVIRIIINFPLFFSYSASFWCCSTSIWYFAW